MNQRNLTFFFTVFTSFLLIQIAFQYFDDNNTRELVQQQEARRITQEKELVASIRSKTATTSQLGVVDYLKPDGNKGMGIRIDDALIISREETLPDNVRILGNENQQLVQKAKTPQFVIYAPQSSTPTQLPDLPPNGRYDLQLLTLLPDSTPTVTLGKWQDGHFSLVASELTEDKRAEFLPAGEAIAFLKVNGKYYPVGTYAPLTEQFTPLRQLQGLITVFQWPERETIRNTDEEQFYLLENEYVQVVFSTKGGAIKEINLPFLSKSDHESVVREIGYDRQIENESPENAYFPSSSYLSYDSTTSKPVTHTKGKLGGYYPLLRRDFHTKSKRTQKVPAKFYAFNLISQFPELAETNYSVTHFDGQTITFVSQQTHRQITKTYRLASSGAPYVIEADLLVDGEDNDLWVTSGIPDVEIISGATAPTLKYRMTRQGKPEVVTESLPQSGITNTTTTPDWLCNSNGFFGVILDPLSTIPAGYKIQTVSAQQAPSRLLALSDADSTLKPSEYTGYQMLLPVQSTGAPLKFRLYAGPFATDILNQVDAFYTDDSTGYNPD
ncbi:MAG: hypothetical protein KDK40_00595 [Chlamydiia bacterium]|nr:hypothetical protein [Chlamydiia bacterium]